MNTNNNNDKEQTMTTDTNNVIEPAADMDRGYRMGTELAANMTVAELAAYVDTLADTDGFPGRYWAGMRFGFRDALVARDAYHTDK
jgi:hypothetical protein